jgi:hypothetical protein
VNFLELLQSVGRNILDGIWRNKLPASLSLLALTIATALALTSDFDERPRYRKFILPEIQKVENQFLAVMHEAEREPDEPWRLLYFLEAHRRAKNALQTIRSDRPTTPRGRKAHSDLIRYYDLVDEELAIIRTEMSNKDSYDYIGEWQRINAQLLPIRQRWEEWLNAPDR